MTITRRHLLQTTSASALLAGLGQSVFAQSQAFPFETARLITGFAAGGTSDTTCRRVATRLQPDYGRAVVVENRTGAGGQIAVTYAKSQPADGATLLQTPTSILTIYPHIYKKLPYDPLVDLSPVTVPSVSGHITEHVELLKAVAAGDADKAAELALHHVTSFEETIRKVL